MPRHLNFKTRGKYDEAESLYRQALALNEANLGPDHPEVGASLNNLAALCVRRAETTMKPSGYCSRP